jgi:lambda repressor-like predicted transcriptional regulator
MPYEQPFRLTNAEVRQLQSLEPDKIFPKDRNKQDSLQLRIDVLLHFRYRAAVRIVAQAFNIPVRNVYHWRNRYRESGLDFLTNVPTLVPKRLHDPNGGRRIDPDRLRADVEALIKRQGTNEFSMATLSYLLRVSTASLKRYRSTWRDLVKSPQQWKVKK